MELILNECPSSDNSYRQANQVVDWLARSASNLPMGNHLFESPPQGCVHLLWRSVAGIYFSRRVQL